MEKFFSTSRVLLATFASRFVQTVCFRRDFRRDPLAHPQLTAMTLTQLADLPASELRARGSC